MDPPRPPSTLFKEDLLMKLPIGLTPEQGVMLAAILGGGISSLLPMRMPDLRWLKKGSQKGDRFRSGQSHSETRTECGIRTFWVPQDREKQS